MTSEIRRFAELLAYLMVLAMLLGSALYAFRLGAASDIFIGGVMAAIVPTIQAISRIGQAEAMNRMAENLAKSSPPHNGEEGK